MTGSAPAARGSGDVAQLGERRLCKPEVVGSNPIVSTAKRKSESDLRRTRLGRGPILEELCDKFIAEVSG